MFKTGNPLITSKGWLFTKEENLLEITFAEAPGCPGEEISTPSTLPDKVSKGFALVVFG